VINGDAGQFGEQLEGTKGKIREGREISGQSRARSQADLGGGGGGGLVWLRERERERERERGREREREREREEGRDRERSGVIETRRGPVGCQALGLQKQMQVPISPSRFPSPHYASHLQWAPQKS